jgi:hypothetical protein
MSFRKRPPSRFADPQMRDFCPVLANDVSVCARQAGPYQALQHFECEAARDHSGQRITTVVTAVPVQVRKR